MQIPLSKPASSVNLSLKISLCQWFLLNLKEGWQVPPSTGLQELEQVDNPQ